MVRTTPAQWALMRKAVGASNIYRNEQVWTMLVATLFAQAADPSAIIAKLCGDDSVSAQGPLDIWFEAAPIPPRKGRTGKTEGNTMLDLAFGDVRSHRGTGCGIEYGRHRPHSWVCFVEAKCLSDCGTRVQYDPLRNQLARVIENLLVFQGKRQFPERLFFTLLTPRVFKKNPTSRLYGYKIAEYKNEPKKLLADIDSCPIPCRNNAKYEYPDLSKRVDALTINWVTYEDLLEPDFGTSLDLVGAPDKIEGVKARIESEIKPAPIAA
jgi:hypothetical protein